MTSQTREAQVCELNGCCGPCSRGGQEAQATLTLMQRSVPPDTAWFGCSGLQSTLHTCSGTGTQESAPAPALLSPQHSWALQWHPAALVPSSQAVF
jgi:hypothetical protein